MKFVIVPNHVRDAINAAIDKELAGRPCDDDSRQYIYNTILDHFDKTGELCKFTLFENCAHDLDEDESP